MRWAWPWRLHNTKPQAQVCNWLAIGTSTVYNRWLSHRYVYSSPWCLLRISLSLLKSIIYFSPTTTYIITRLQGTNQRHIYLAMEGVWKEPFTLDCNEKRKLKNICNVNVYNSNVMNWVKMNRESRNKNSQSSTHTSHTSHVSPHCNENENKTSQTLKELARKSTTCEWRTRRISCFFAF